MLLLLFSTLFLSLSSSPPPHPSPSSPQNNSHSTMSSLEQISLIVNDITSLKHKLVERDRKIEELEHLLRGRDAVIADLESENHHDKLQLSEIADKRIYDLETRVGELNDKLHQANKQIEEHTSHRTDRDLTVRKLENEIVRMNMDRARVGREVEKEKDDLKTQIKKLNEVISSMQMLRSLYH